MFKIEIMFKLCNLKKISTTHAFSSTFSNTIFAVSSGQGKCGVAVIRISGPEAGSALQELTGMKILPKPRYAYLKNIKSPITGEILDRGLVLWFPGPKSFTGEDSCELQVHGGTAVISSILKTLESFKGLRLAEPGEFTRRSFYNSKLDLTEVEGISDLIAAETEIQRKQAFLQSQGSLSKLYLRWKTDLVKCLASLEAFIDFHESEGLEDDIVKQTRPDVEKLMKEISQHLNDNRKGEILRSGVRTVILGEPNVGKSSLFNSLCLKPAAIVTPIAGTTRDVLEKILDIGGYPLILSDTAGLRSRTTDVIEMEGINRALIAYKESDLVLLVIDSVKYLNWYNSNPQLKFYDFVLSYLEKLNMKNLIRESLDGKLVFNKPTILICNKIDLIKDADLLALKNVGSNLISCNLNTGISILLEDIIDKLKSLCGEPSEEHPSVSQIRHRRHLHNCLKNLEKFLHRGDSSQDIVLMVEELRKAVADLGKITGTVTTEQLLDVIFKEFCIGK